MSNLKKKIAIVGSSILGMESLQLGEDEVREIVAKEMERVQALEEEKRPPFIPIAMNVTNDMMGIATMIMKETAKTGIPVILCSEEQKNEFENMNLEGKNLDEIISDFKPTLTMEITNQRLPELVTERPYEYYFEHEKKNFGGHKQGRNRKLRRR